MSLSRREFLAASLVAGTAAACGFFGDDGPERVEYGNAPSQFGELFVPSGDPRGTIVLVHGGSWQDDTDLTLVRPMARDLHREGYIVWNIEYRRVGEPGGGWPGTFEDVGTAIDVAVLAEDHPITPDRIIVVGHSAGGTLALWSADRDGDVTPTGYLSLAGVTDLETCVQQVPELAGACTQLLGGFPADVGQRYREASPIRRLPTGHRLALVHGEDDDIVPISQSVDYTTAARAAGDHVEMVRVPDAGHFQLIDIKHPAYGEVLTAINKLFTNPAA